MRRSKPPLSRLLAAATMLAIASTGLVATASPAQAASTECTAPTWTWGTRGCTTPGTISANSGGRFIDVTFWGCRDTNWKVWDTGTGRTVGSGKTPSGGYMSQRIPGLYGTYKASISVACSKDRIRIDNT